MDFTLLALATWRLTSLLYAEDGPYIVFERLRRKLGVYYDEYGNRQADNEIGKAFNCPACLSVWVGVLVSLSYLLVSPWLWLPLALSTVSIIIEKVVSYGES